MRSRRIFTASAPTIWGRLRLGDERTMDGGPLPGRVSRVWLAAGVLALLALTVAACIPQPGTSLTPTEVIPTRNEAAPRPTENPTSAAQASPGARAARLGFEVRGWT